MGGDEIHGSVAFVELVADRAEYGEVIQKTELAPEDEAVNVVAAAKNELHDEAVELDVFETSEEELVLEKVVVVHSFVKAETAVLAGNVFVVVK